MTSSIAQRSRELLLGSLNRREYLYRDFSFIHSFYSDPWYNFIIPKVSKYQFRSDREVQELIFEMESREIQTSFYIHKDIHTGWNKWLIESGYELLGDENYFTQHQEISSAVNLPSDYKFTTTYDTESVIAMLEKCFPTWPTEREYFNRFELIKTNPTRGHIEETVVIEHLGVPVASGSILIDSYVNLGYLHNTGVLPEHRHKGLHTALVRYRQNFAQEYGINETYALVDSGDNSFKSLKKMGFKSDDLYYIYTLAE